MERMKRGGENKREMECQSGENAEEEVNRERDPKYIYI